MMTPPWSPACERNREPIAEALSKRLPPPADGRLAVLEIGSGTGQHASYFVHRLPWLAWQSSDRAENLEGLRARFAADGVECELAEPLALELGQDAWPSRVYDGVFTANTLHIMPFRLAPVLFDGAYRVLKPGGCLLIYGPFRAGGKHTAPSNLAFDCSLRARDPDMGIRDVEAIEIMAQSAGFKKGQWLAMPANNQLLWFEKENKVNEFK